MWYRFYGDSVVEQRDADIQNNVEIGCQFMVQNTNTGRPGLVETPLCTGSRVTVHQSLKRILPVSPLMCVWAQGTDMF